MVHKSEQVCKFNGLLLQSTTRPTPAWPACPLPAHACCGAERARRHLFVTCATPSVDQRARIFMHLLSFCSLDGTGGRTATPLIGWCVRRLVGAGS
ncbi:hypothetical protein VFPFJ_08982 [Purpureocillium lilacinum]|uniref:Uncharacterized protein n=1 Tax=Purpureocillium lilacinum TaxID=33203 RepID=A0A179H1B5_PURLI|nr:hypothetical protein VFPFJ_08982 [Purpureocillium lilacinum]OAQ83179.1 hypothetical protein VFPFJ_08982 [Purpureocillium lilacinum]